MIEYAGFIITGIIVTFLVIATQAPKGKNYKRLDFYNNK